MKVKLPSGSMLNVTLAPFKDSRSLYQAMLEEMKPLKVDAGTELDINLFKDVFCACLSSKKIESAVWECLKRVTCDDVRVTEDYFEDEAKRADYLPVCFEVAKANIMPFTKSLYAEYLPILEKLKKGLA